MGKTCAEAVSLVFTKLGITRTYTHKFELVSSAVYKSVDYTHKFLQYIHTSFYSPFIYTSSDFYTLSTPPTITTTFNIISNNKRGF